MAVLSDDFNRANELLAASSNWDEIRTGLEHTIVSNQCTQVGTDAPISRHATEVGDTDQQAEITVVSWSATNDLAGLAVRVDDSSDKECLLFIVQNRGTNSTNTYRMFTYDGTTADNLTAVASGAAVTGPSAPFTMRVEINGNDIEGFIDDVSVLTYTVPSGYTAGTRVGFYSKGPTLDDWSGQPLVTDSITMTSPVAYQTFQRDSDGEADIAISGTYAGTTVPTTIQARFDGGTWTVIDASPSGGTFSGTLSGQTGQGTLEVRFTNATSVTHSAANVGIGDVFLIAGQSNAEGHGDNNQSYSASDTCTMYRASAWSELADPTGPRTFGSAYPPLATLLAADQSVPIAIINMAVASTAIDVWDGAGAAQYDNAVAAVTAAGCNGIKAVLWCQGERDANIGTSEADYRTGMIAMISGFNTDLTGSPPVVVSMTPNNAYAGLDMVRKVQQEMFDRPDCLAGPVLHDIDLTGGDSLHIESDADLDKFSDRYFVALSGLYGGSGDVRTRATSANQTGSAEITVNCNRTVTGASLSATPWHITDETGDNNVTAAAVSGNTVVLTLARTLDGAATLDFVELNDAEGVNVPVGTIEAISVPLEPIYSMAITDPSVTSPGIRNAVRMGL